MSRFLVQSHFPRYALPTLLGILIISGLYASSLSSYLLFHSLIELFCIVTAFVIFVLAWHTRRIQDNQYLLFVGIALLGTAAIELVHALAYKGMGVFAGSSADLPTQLWIAFRYLFSISLLIAPLFIRRRFRAWRMLALYIGVTIALLVSIFSGLFPACFVEGSGLTPFKINSEYVIALIFVASLGLLIANRQSFDGTVFGLMAGAIVSSIASELAFTEYVSVFGLANMIGHFFLLASMVLIYRALAITGIVEPSSLLFRNLKMSEAALQRAHDELKNSEAEITAMLENVPIIMLLVDRERRVRKANVAASRFANRPQEDMLGRRGGEAIRCLHSLDVPEGCGFGPSCGTCAVRRTILDTFESGANRQGVEARVSFDHRGRREELIFLISTSLLTLSDEQLNLVCIEDITERKKAEEEILKLSEDMAARNLELEALNKELEAFNYSISHDLRAPLRSMSGFSKIMMEDYAEKLDDQGKDYLTRIRNSSEKMTRLIDDLLRLSKISRQEIERINIDLCKLAESVVHNLREASAGRNVEVVIRKDVRASADPNLMRVVMTNLFDNAWKFTGKTANARVEFGSLERDGKTAYFVKDNGAGFDQEYAYKMFWPFHRLHSDREFAGTGIGLAIVDRIVRRHGGKVWAEGEVGKGATFFFTLG